MISAIADILFKLNALFVNRIVVNQRNYKSALGNTIYSNKEYFIDGVITIDNPNFNITVPSGGISIKGYDFDKSQIVCSLDNYTLFDSPIGGSGNVLCTDVSFETSGANSKVYDLTDATGFNAIECNRVNYNNCTSLGELTNYRQGLESGTGRFGGTPNLILSGTWVGGFRISTSIVRSIDNAMSGARDVAYYVIFDTFVLNENDTVRLQVENTTASRNVTAELDSFWTLQAK